MILNLEPDVILTKLRRCFVMVTNFVQREPGSRPGLLAGVERVLPQYDNAETCNRLLSFLTGSASRKLAGSWFSGLNRSTSCCELLRISSSLSRRRLNWMVNSWRLTSARRFVCFFPTANMAETLAKRLAKHSLQIVFSEIAESGEEGAFRVALSD